MRNIVNTYVEKFLKERKEQLRLIGIIAALAVIVVLGVFWRLHYTGVAMTNEVYCGAEEHKHDESCYEDVLICGLEEAEPVEGHTHSDACYETVTALICGQEEAPGHTHTEECYETIPAQLICGQDEYPGHYHDAGCYDEAGNLICGSDEYEGHTHTEACWSYEEQILICDQEEYEGHTHTDECYQTDTVLICNLEECDPVEGHTHSEDCYEKQLVCGLEEHTHTIECMTDENADLEMAGDWEATLPNDLTGIWAEDVVKIAQSQLSYTESSRNFILGEDGETRKGYTRYGAWYGNEYGDWDAMFASFCLYYAGVPEDLMPEASGVYAWTFALDEKDLYENVKVGEEEYTPVPGDLIFLDTDTTDEIEADHVGIIENVATEFNEDTEEETITKIVVIEGDCEDMVKEKEYSPADDRIAGYGKLPEQPGLVVEAETETESETETEIESEAETETETEDETEAESETEIETESETEIETETETETETKTETETESETEIETETETESESESETEIIKEDDSYYHEVKLFELWYFEAEEPEEPDQEEDESEEVSEEETEAEPAGEWKSAGLIEGVLSYTEENGEKYYLIPMKYLEEVYEEEGFDFKEEDLEGIEESPFAYASDADDIDAEDEKETAAYYPITAKEAVAEGVKAGWYLRVQDPTEEDSAEEEAAEFLEAYVKEDTKAETLAGYSADPFVVEAAAEEADQADEADEAGAAAGIVTLAGAVAETEEEAAEEQHETEDEILHTAYVSYEIEPLDWSGSGMVVLNLGNGNGKYNFADYAGNKNSGTALRYTTGSLADYAADDGSMTIHLPSDKDLDSTFTVVDASGSLPVVTVALGNAQAYDYQLVGWVNIATGEYYDVSEGAATANIDLDNENVFYADWIAATYDHGSSSDANLRDDTVSTAGFVTMHMYDYNELYNLYSESLVQNEDDDGTLWEAWTDSGNLYNSLPYGTGKRLTSSFIFVNDGTTNQTQSSTGGMLTWPNNKTAGNTWPGSGDPPRDATAIWGITSPDSAPMDMLFDPDSNAVGVHYVGDADYLFWIDKNTGYYTYNSKTSAATYNQDDKRFYVYTGTQAVDGTSFSCFLPFNTYGEELSAFNGSVDYWFGMDMEVNFYLPDATGTGGNKANDAGDDMVFNFSGDDDILIFIDDALVLDMSGIHDESFGSINFSDGTVRMAMSEADLNTATPTTISLSAGSHDLKVYYMERGGYASNLEIQFNVASIWEYETGEVQTITAEKTWIDAQGNVIKPENLPDVYKNKGVEVGLFDVLGPAKEGTIGYTQNGNVYTVTFTDDSGVTRTYVYDASGPSLTYTEVSDEGTISGTDDQVDSEGRVIDKDGYVVAWMENGYLHIRMDKQTLNDDNGWYYAWELLDPDGDYEVLELTSSSSYTTSTTRENLTTYYYWSIIGDSEIEDSFMFNEPLPVILTEAAQEASNTLGNTKDAMGWVIVATENDITTQQIEFSQIAELQKTENKITGQTSYKTIAGVTSQSQVDTLGSGAIWYVVDAETKTKDLSGSYLEDFHLYCDLNGTKYYLTLQGTTLTVTSDLSAAGIFCYDSLGELLVVLDDGDGTTQTTERVEIQADGTITIGYAEAEAALDDIRIYTLQETKTSGFAFTASNTFLPSFTLEKVDSITEDSLAGVSFTLQNADDLYYTFDTDTDEISWSDNSASVLTGEDGTYIFHYLEDGTYTLTETKAADGYNMLTSTITIVIKDGEIVNNYENDTYITVSGNGLIITVKNSTSAELPNTGGPGTNIFTLAGLLLMISAAYFLYRNKKRNPSTM